MRTIGINVAADIAYLALAQSDEVLAVEPYSIKPPQGLDGADALLALQSDVRKILTAHGIERLRVLDAETNNKGSYASFRNRFAIEVTIMLAAAELKIDGGRLSRAQARSILALPRSEPLHTYASSLCSPVGPYWNKKRDLSALTAIAAGREQ